MDAYPCWMNRHGSAVAVKLDTITGFTVGM
jgi:hypothetical protein